MKFIALLRGINVGGNRLIRMKSLVEMMMDIGFTEVKTYIQSGNVVFDTTETCIKKIEEKISTHILNIFGFEVPVVVLTSAALDFILMNNTFLNDQNFLIEHCHVTICSDILEEAQFEKINFEKYLPNQFDIKGKYLYLHCPNGYSNCKLSNNLIESIFDTNATTRNWKTILALHKMI